MQPIPPERLEVDALVLANSVEVKDNLFYMLGGGWTRCWPVEGGFPFDRVLALAVLIRVPYHETNIEHKFSLSLRDSDEAELLRAEGGFKVGRGVDLAEGMSQLAPVALNAGIKFEKAGIYYVSVALAGAEEKKIAFQVLPRAPRD